MSRKASGWGGRWARPLRGGVGGWVRDLEVNFFSGHIQRSCLKGILPQSSHSIAARKTPHITTGDRIVRDPADLLLLKRLRDQIISARLNRFRPQSVIS